MKGHSVVPFFSFIFWPCGVFIAAHGFSLVAAGEHYSSLQRVGFSLQWFLLLWHIGLVAPGHVESSQARDRTHVPCIGRRILNH